MRVLWLVCLLLSGIWAWALQETEPLTPADETVTDSAEDPALQPVPTLTVDDGLSEKFDTTSVFYDTIGKLLVVVGLVVLLGWLSKKFLPGRLSGMAQGGQMKLLQNLPMGTRRFVSLVEVDGKRYMLGVTETQINLLKALDDEDVFARAMSEVEEPRRVADMLLEEES